MLSFWGEADGFFSRVQRSEKRSRAVYGTPQAKRGCDLPRMDMVRRGALVRCLLAELMLRLWRKSDVGLRRTPVEGMGSWE